MHRLAPLFLLSLLFTGCSSPDEPAELLDRLTFHGEPIPPWAVAQLSTDLGDPEPTIRSIDVVGSISSNKYGPKPEVRDGILFSTALEPGDRGFACYRYLGHTTHNVGIIDFSISGGGSGVFRSLIFVRVESSKVVNDGHPETRLNVRCVGEQVLGDRDDSPVRIEGDKVIVSEPPSRWPFQADFVRPLIIELTPVTDP